MEFAQTTGFSGIISWSPFSLAALLLGIVAILASPKKWVLATFLAFSVLMAMSLHIVVFGLNLMPHRVLLLFAWLRFFLRGEYRGLQLSSLDKGMILLSSCLVFTETLQAGTAGFVFAVANNGLDGLGTYFLCRILIRERQDLLRAVAGLAGVCVAVAGFMCVEFLTRRNLLGALGAVQEFVQVRKGLSRCAASFGIPITAGTFGAVLLPLFLACWWQDGRMKKWAIPGCIASTLITLTAGSAGPLSTYILAGLAFLMWPLRGRLRTIRWAAVFCLVVLHLVMKAPVWALIARVQIVPGASAYHRFNVIDTFVNHIGEWWMYGVPSTEKWGWMMDDVANQYCVVAKHGGLLALFLFIRILTLGFREVGLTLKETGQDRATERLVWGLGVMLFAHATVFFSISYYDQIKVVWYLSLGMVASARLLIQPSKVATELVPEEESGVPDAFGLNPGISQG